MTIQYYFIGSLNMSMRSEHSGYPSRKIVTHCLFFRCSLRMKIHQNIPRLLARWKDLVHHQEGVVRPVVHVAPADQVHHQQAQALRPVENAPALPRALRGKVGRTQHVRMLVQIGRDLLLGKRVVAQRDQVRARGKNIIRLPRGDAASSGVFAVDDDEIRALFAPHAAQQAVQGCRSPPRRPRRRWLKFSSCHLLLVCRSCTAI